MKKSIQLHPSMGEAVVAHLSKLGQLPKAGILAGQAVDSAITDLFGNGGGVYNDLDIFCREARPLENRNVLRANELSKRSRFEFSTDYYDYSRMNVLLKAVSTYQIHAVQREELINTVKCVTFFPQDQLSAEQVIGGFDINCTHVAVDLETNRLVWDREYEEFLRSRQLRISMMHTPWHTFLRLMKKAQELPNVYVNREVAAEACTAVANSSWLNMMLNASDISMSFGKKNHELAVRLESEWKPYFNLESKTLYLERNGKWSVNPDKSADSGKSVELWHMSPRATLSARTQQQCDTMGSGILVFGSKLIEKAHRKIGPAAYDKLNAIVTQQRKLSKPETYSDMGPHKLVNHEDFSEEERGSGVILASAQLFDVDYVQGQALPAMASKLTEWLRQHNGLTDYLTPGMTLDEQYRFVQLIIDTCRECGKKYFDGDTQLGIGVLETLSKRKRPNTKEEIEAVLHKYYVDNHSPFEVDPLPLPTAFPARFAGFKVTELLSALELRNEGTLMGHCVGGYADAVKENNSRILAIRYKDERRSVDCSTVELHGNFSAESKHWNVFLSQNYTAGNKTPSKQNQKFVAYLTAYFTQMNTVAQCQVPSAHQTARNLKQVARGIETQIKRLVYKVAYLKKQADKLTVPGSKPVKSIHEARLQLQKAESSLATLKANAVFLRELAGLQEPSNKATDLVKQKLLTQSRTKALASVETAPGLLQAAA